MSLRLVGLDLRYGAQVEAARHVRAELSYLAAHVRDQLASAEAEARSVEEALVALLDGRRMCARRHISGGNVAIAAIKSGAPGALHAVENVQWTFSEDAARCRELAREWAFYNSEEMRAFLAARRRRLEALEAELAAS